MNLKVIVRHANSKNRDNIIFDGGYDSWSGAVPRKGELIEISDNLKKAYDLPKQTFAFVQDVIWNFENDIITVNATV